MGWSNTAHDNTDPLTVRELVPRIEEAEAKKPTKTITQVPEIIATSTADTVVETLILPFHFQTTEYCQSGTKYVKGRYGNGNLVRDMDLHPGLINNLDHLVPGFPPLSIGPFNHSASKLRYAYSNGVFVCEWNDDETWRQCGECRAALWSGPTLNCGSDGSRVRRSFLLVHSAAHFFQTKHMDCSFILGIKQ